MEQFSTVLTQEQVNVFPSNERDVYFIQTIGLSRDPIECMKIMEFWIWIELLSISDFNYNICSLPLALINKLADEAVICLIWINFDGFVIALAKRSIDGGIHLTVEVLEKDYITLPYFFIHKVEAQEKIAKEYNRVCVRALSHIMHNVLEKNSRHAVASISMANSSSVAARIPHIIGSMVSMTLNPPTQCIEHQQQLDGANEEDEVENRKMFATFSKGYPMVARELKDFLMKNFGIKCIKLLHMRGVTTPKQSLYAQIMLIFGAIIDLILNGMDNAKFNINGKHVWIRKFVPYKRPPIKSDKIPESSTSASTAGTGTASSTNL